MNNKEAQCKVSLSFPEAIKIWKQDKKVGTLIELSGGISVSDLKALPYIPFEVMIAKTAKGVFALEGERRRAVELEKFCKLLGIPVEQFSVALHNHPHVEGEPDVNYPSLSDYHTLGTNGTRIDLIATPLWLYDFSYHDAEDDHPVEAFIDFLRSKHIVTDKWRIEYQVQRTNTQFRALLQLPDEEQQDLYKEFEKQRKGPSSRQISWDDPRINDVIALFN